MTGILKEFENVYDFVKEEANITLQFKASDTHESGSLVFYINYVGPLQANINSRDVKIDITRGEIMEYGIEDRKIFRGYPDLPEDSFTLSCYSLSEVLIEKMAALMGRTEPRDLYDFWYLTENERLNTKHYKPEFELFSTLCLFILSVTSFAQSETGTGSIKGTITTSDNKPAASVTVRIKGIKKAALTNNEGRFIIKSIQPGGYSLEISSIGF